MIIAAIFRLAGQLAVTVLFAGAAWETYQRLGPNGYLYAGVLAITASICGLKFVFQLLLFFPKLIIHLWVMRPSQRAVSAPVKTETAVLVGPQGGQFFGVSG